MTTFESMIVYKTPRIKEPILITGGTKVDGKYIIMGLRKRHCFCCELTTDLIKDVDMITKICDTIDSMN